MPRLRVRHHGDECEADDGLSLHLRAVRLDGGIHERGKGSVKMGLLGITKDCNDYDSYVPKHAAAEYLDLSDLQRFMVRRFCHVVYALTDPRKPHRIAYVGSSKNHVLLRYFQHIQDGLATNSQGCTKRGRWLVELAANRMSPSIAILESVPEVRDLLRQRESFWIANYKAMGEAWINDLSEIKHEHRKWLNVQLGAA